MRAMIRVAAAMFVLGAVGLTPAVALPGVLTGPISYGGHDYYLLDTSTWANAEAKAVAMGGHLVTLSDQAEQDWVFGTFNAYDDVTRLYWIGLNDRAAEGQFVWASDEQVDFTYWAPGEPNNAGNEDFVSMFYQGHTHSGKWNDWSDRTRDPIGITFVGVVEIAPPIQWRPADGGNGHYYEYITGSLSWSQAEAAAQAHTFMGAQGHLATVTSEQETSFLAANFSTSFSRPVWLGAQQDAGMAPDEGWQWVTGETWDYTQWMTGEPNDAGGDERHLIVAGYNHANHWQWNDGNATNLGYLVEYPVLPGDFDTDGDVDVDDIDILRNNMGNLAYDLDGDGDTDADDLAHLVEDLVEWYRPGIGTSGVGTEMGDFNLDGVINTTDLTILAANFGRVLGGWSIGHANTDSVIDTTDLAILATNFGFVASGEVPEPATLFVMGCGAIGLLRRHRRA